MILQLNNLFSFFERFLSDEDTEALEKVKEFVFRVIKEYPHVIVNIEFTDALSQVAYGYNEFYGKTKFFKNRRGELVAEPKSRPAVLISRYPIIDDDDNEILCVDFLFFAKTWIKACASVRTKNHTLITADVVVEFLSISFA